MADAGASAAEGPVAGSVDVAHTALIICGALGREVLDLVEKHDWDAEVFGVPAVDHMFPERIAPHVEARIRELRPRFERLIVVYGDCGSKGALDAVLDRYDVERIAGPHCYEMYAEAQFEALMEEETGTFFLTDFLARAYRGTLMKSMGLDRFPQLKDEYFRNYRRVVYLAQTHDEQALENAEAFAEFLGLPLEVRKTGYGALESRLVALINRE